MLTASLQSTWEQKNRQGRPKYGSHQTNYGEDSESKGNAFQTQDKMGKSSNYSSQQAQQQSPYYPPNGNRSGLSVPSDSGNAMELPNLKVPQVGLFWLVARGPDILKPPILLSFCGRWVYLESTWEAMAKTEWDHPVFHHAVLVAAMAGLAITMELVAATGMHRATREGCPTTST